MTANADIAMIETIWPVTLERRRVAYRELQTAIAARLAAAGLPCRFSHVGIVVSDVQASVKALRTAGASEWKDVEPVWGAAFGCHIARAVTGDTEIELIQPVETSFLRDFLTSSGDGVHHVSFELRNLANAMAVLLAAGEAMADPRVLDGLHGRICFFNPGRMSPLALELCEPVHA